MIISSIALVTISVVSSKFRVIEHDWFVAFVRFVHRVLDIVRLHCREMRLLVIINKVIGFRSGPFRQMWDGTVRDGCE